MQPNADGFPSPVPSFSLLPGRYIPQRSGGWKKRKLANANEQTQAVWHEAADYSANQFNFELGAILGQDSLPKNTYKVLDRKNKQIWSTPIEKAEWQNFAIQLDYGKK